MNLQVSKGNGRQGSMFRDALWIVGRGTRDEGLDWNSKSYGYITHYEEYTINSHTSFRVLKLMLRMYIINSTTAFTFI